MGQLMKLVLFGCAYSPLITILLLQHFQIASISIQSMVTILLSFIPIIIGVFFGIYLYSQTKKETGIEFFEVISVENKTQEILSYIVPYIISLMGIDIRSISGVLILLILFFILYSVYSNSSLIYINPLLSAMGYKLYKAQTLDRNGEEKTLTIITKKSRINEKQKIELHNLSDMIYLEGNLK